VEYTEAVAYLDRHIALGVRPGLKRIKVLLDLMARPDHGYPIIHITGSNGKTSTARIATSILAAHGLAAGTFVSPHLERVEERLSLNGIDATPEEFAAAVTDVAPFVELLEAKLEERPTYFELTAALGFAWFAERAVDVAVVEVGLGGRLDATNAADAAVAVLTGISREHTAFLGDSIRDIAREKLAIAKERSVLVVGKLPPDAAEEAEAHAQKYRLRIVRQDRDFRVATAAMAVGGWQVDIEGTHGHYENLYLPVHGRHQTTNLAVAVAAVEELLGRELSTDAVRDGVAATRIPGRLEVVGRGPLVILDGAHNEEAFSVLATALEDEFRPARWTLVLGVMGDKRLRLMLAHMAGKLDLVVATAVDSPRAVAPETIVEVVGDVFGDEVATVTAPTVGEAIGVAFLHTPRDGAILVAGSLYVVGEARTHLRAR
jgi:dihydrofolate synthase/folylpolyglutamate synthase